MAYADYAFYNAAYCGTAIPLEKWGQFSAKADAYLDRVTFFRLHRGATLTDAVRMAACAVADAFYTFEAARCEHTPGVKSESVDGDRTDYEDVNAVLASKDAALLDAVNLFLPPGDALRYRGV